MSKLYGLSGAIVEQYDVSLFYILSSVLALHYFPQDNALPNNLFYVYLLVPVSALAKPLGGLFFGRLGDKYSSEYALTWTIVGMGLCSVCIGLLPSYSALGMACSILFLSLKMAQVFCRGGEYITAAMYTLELSPRRKTGLTSGLYCTTYVAGSLLATAVCRIFISEGALGNLSASSELHDPGVSLWRYPFLLGGVFSMLVLGLRLRLKKIGLPPAIAKPKLQLIQTLCDKNTLCFIAVTSSLCVLCFIGWFIGNFAVVNQQITLSDLLLIKQIDLFFYFFCLILMGTLTDHFLHKKLMRLSFAVTVVLAPLVLFRVPDFGFTGLLFTILLFKVLAAAAFAPYHCWYKDVFSAHPHRLTLSSMGYALGSMLGGTFLPLAQWCTNQPAHANHCLLGVAVLIGVFMLLGIFGLGKIAHSPVLDSLGPCTGART